MRWGLLILAALAVLALVLDLRRLQSRLQGGGASAEGASGDRKDLVLGLGGPRYADPAGRFSLVPPRGWRMERQPEGTTYDVSFYGPGRMDLSLQVSESPTESFGDLLKKIWAIEKKMDADMHVETFTFAGRTAVKRTMRLYTQKLLVIDFVEGGVAHHLQFGAPPEVFDQYLPQVLDLLETYQPGP